MGWPVLPENKKVLEVLEKEWEHVKDTGINVKTTS